TLLHVPAGIMATTPIELAEYLCVLFAYGLVFSLLYVFSKSLWGPLLPHILNNLFFAVVSFE
ncbi:MAG: CPBP family intramembrane metalloprotease, partial [Planctomycetaceae bacterium]|nr:CPBP family intramembrane metalloprotease [Planctomycetaceae bacterium]